MREGVAPRHYIDGTGSLDNLLGNVHIKKSRNYIQALRPRQIGNILRNVHANGLYSSFLKRRQKHAVVAPELYHLLRMEPLYQPMRIGFEVIHERLDRARRERIILEQYFRIHRIQHLNQPAAGAGVYLQRILFFSLNRFLSGEETTRERKRSEVQNGLQIRTLASTAICSHCNDSFFNFGFTPRKAFTAKLRYLRSVSGL